jgi:two-component system sensor histidine kinase YesM
MRRLKQFFHKLSIRKKMLTILCLVGMLPVLVLGISLGINSYRTVLKYREKDMTNTLQQACGIVDYQMYACQQMMNYFVYNQDAIRQRRHSVMNCIRKYQILSVR